MNKFLSIFIIGLFALNANATIKALINLRDSAVRLELGSGAIVRGPSGHLYILTNDHVCSVSKDFMSRIHIQHRGETLIGNVVKFDAQYDLCAITFSPFHNQKGLEIAKETDPDEKLYTRGYPLGVLGTFKGNYIPPYIYRWHTYVKLEEYGNCPPKTKPTTKGPICLVTHELALTDLYVQPGSSGSPVVNAEGELVGVIESKSSMGSGMVPLHLVYQFFMDL